MFETIDDLKKKLDQHRPLSHSIVKNLQEDLILRWTYHSNAFPPTVIPSSTTFVSSNVSVLPSIAFE